MATKPTAPAKKKATKKAATKKAAPKKAAPTKVAAKKAAATKAAAPAKKALSAKAATTAPKKKSAVKAKVAEKPTKKAASKKAAAAKPTKAAAKSVEKAPTKKKAAISKEQPKAAAKETISNRDTIKEHAERLSAKTASKKKAAKKTTRKSTKKAAKMPEPPLKRLANVGQRPKTDLPPPIIEPTTVAVQRTASRQDPNKIVKPTTESKAAKENFKVDDHIVYPAHGVGRIVAIEKQMIAGIANELFLIDFEQEKMRLRVPTAKAQTVGMRRLSDPKVIDKAVETLKGRARIKRTMWSRRAQEYEAKINSGDVNSVAEVVRDLYRAADQPEQSYSERQLFEAALDRLAREVAAVRKSELGSAIAELEGALHQKQAA